MRKRIATVGVALVAAASVAAGVAIATDDGSTNTTCTDAQGDSLSLSVTGEARERLREDGLSGSVNDERGRSITDDGKTVTRDC